MILNVVKIMNSVIKVVEVLSILLLEINTFETILLIIDM